MTLRIGTRGSPLALWQANHVAALLTALPSPIASELILIETAGDKIRDRPLAQVGGDGLFTREIQRALLDGRCDIAVHSLKDLPTAAVEGIALAAVPERGPTGDVLVSSRHARFDDLPRGAVLASGSLRRQAQVLWRRPDLKLVGIRGNLGTRLRKLETEALDGLILAQAGLARLDLAQNMISPLDPSWILPAVGQGALGLECRSEDQATRQQLSQIDHRPSHVAVLAERAFLRTLAGGCMAPVGAAATVVDGQLTLRGVLLDPPGRQRLAGILKGTTAEAEVLGECLARDLLGRGGEAIMRDLPRGPEEGV